MPRGKGQIWDHFWEGEAANASHRRAYCLGCIRNEMSKANLSDKETLALENDTSFKDACQKVHSVLGVKTSMVAHILGGTKACRYASDAAKTLAKRLRGKSQGKRERSDDEDEDEDEGSGAKISEPKPSKKHKAADRVEKHQSKLKVYKGIDIPFSDKEKKAIQVQVARATASARLPDQWIEDPEVLKLMYMMRTKALDVIPSRKVLGGRLLKEESKRVEDELVERLEGQYVTLTCDGVKDVNKDSLVGVSVSADFKPYLVQLYNATADKKDGDSMCNAYETMIDSTEKKYRCTVVALGTDNDGGSRAGRVKLGIIRPWLFLFPCGAHQGQLVLADYFKCCPEGAETSEDATDIIGWLNNHGYVRVIFNDVQQEQTNQVLKYLVANLTRWTTHSVAFLRLEDLKEPLQFAAFSRRMAIIEAQVGRETGTKGQELRAEAEDRLNLIRDDQFWKRLETLNEDIEPICYATNIMQSDRARPDIVLLAFVGMFQYFRNLPLSRSQLSKAMCTRLEKRWKGFDQKLMITALILNPYEKVARFGPKAGVDVMQIDELVVEMYDKWINRPMIDLDPDEEESELEHRRCRRTEFSTAFLHYFAGTGAFKNWERLKDKFKDAHGDDPLIFWESMKTNRDVYELVDFACMILSIVQNTAGNERQFSQVKLRKDRLRNRLTTEKLEKKIKLAENLRQQHYADGLRDIREARKNHSDDRVVQLLEVPRYDQVLSNPQQDDDYVDAHVGRSRRHLLVNSRRKWRLELKKWTDEAERADQLTGDNTVPPPLPESSASHWLPRSLELLFGRDDQQLEPTSSMQRPRRERRTAYTEEQLYMELLAQEAEDEIPDDGALEGSGDEYEG
ncbi:hypothetical protein K435DRAFT_863575 [Dendrothele bispora CBS 962.96]|uniref:Uncharacterized protein n=1 Tax=Dendrothele bispora (strain CBS 962.96) TaxID=1314807 RepID=A0A4S8LPE0_DENBC|nr:hypothetical protein K435DRAFT_863575 [Dendrothele bispora CBS 962.96]